MATRRRSIRRSWMVSPFESEDLATGYGRLQVVDEITAGHPSGRSLAPGEAAAIMTASRCRAVPTPW